jgi:hypothetical protein
MNGMFPELAGALNGRSCSMPGCIAHNPALVLNSVYDLMEIKIFNLNNSK